MRKWFLVFLVLTLALTTWAADGRLPHVLVTNDDGVDAPGLAALVSALKGEYRITVCAPASEQSAVGHGITYRTPVLVEDRDSSDGVRRFAIHAQPATCVRIGLSALLAGDPPALVLSGINRGDNAGRSVWVSGTVAGAREGALFGLPAVGFSAARPRGVEPDFAAAGEWARLVLERLRLAGLPRARELVKVDIPFPAATALGIRVAGVGQAQAAEERYEERPGPNGERLFVSRYAPPEHDALGTDVQALADGFVTVTALSLDQTEYRRLPELASIGLEAIRIAPALTQSGAPAAAVVGIATRTERKASQAGAQ
jgi:5'-nucleotidase